MSFLIIQFISFFKNVLGTFIVIHMLCYLRNLLVQQIIHSFLLSIHNQYQSIDFYSLLALVFFNV
jgi:hypothetical protein